MCPLALRLKFLRVLLRSSLNPELCRQDIRGNFSGSRCLKAALFAHQDFDYELPLPTRPLSPKHVALLKHGGRERSCRSTGCGTLEVTLSIMLLPCVFLLCSLDSWCGLGSSGS